eukprot:GHVS01043826.1.p1 GENE.GHVS01043826.1~~GHVS01043826.1.p1  ORF type:complete len:101 (-),score=14.48 GHVS01043826.1:633-935(-)
MLCPVLCPAYVVSCVVSCICCVLCCVLHMLCPVLCPAYVVSCVVSCICCVLCCVSADNSILCISRQQYIVYQQTTVPPSDMAMRIRLDGQWIGADKVSSS